MHTFNRYEWSLAYTNSHHWFQFFGHWEHGKTTDDMYMLAQYGPEDIALKDPPGIMAQDFTQVPTTYNKSAPYRPYIQRLPHDPKPFLTDLAIKTSGGHLLVSPYCENVISFLKKNRVLYTDWKLVAESLGIPVAMDFMPHLPLSSADLDASRPLYVHHA